MPHDLATARVEFSDGQSWARPAAPVTLLPMIDPAAWQNVPAPRRSWSLDEWIPARQATYLTGAGSAGKSLLAQQLCTCVALGLPFLGVKTTQSVAVYLTCEDDADELHRRQEGICAALGVTMAQLSGKLHLVSLVGAIGNELALFDQSGKMQTTPAWATLRASVLNVSAGFVALDNVAHLFGGNENIRHEVAGFCGLLNSLAADADASVLFVGHPNKAGDDYSGSTAWSNQVRSRLFLERPRSEGGYVDPDERVLKRPKANYAQNGGELAFRWHQWAFVRMQDLSSSAAAEMDEVIRAAADNAAFLECLTERTKQRRAVSEKPCPSYAPKVFDAMPESKRIGKHRLNAAMDRLFRLGKIERGTLWPEPGKGRNVVGIRLVSPDSPDTPHPHPTLAPHTVPEHPHTSAPDHPSHTPPPKGGMAFAAKAGAAIQAPGETGLEPIPGYEDFQ